MEKGRFTILEEDKTIYPHTCLCPVIYMGTVVTEWEMQWFSPSTQGQDIVGMTAKQNPCHVELPIC
jgi:hypothetical protein